MPDLQIEREPPQQVETQTQQEEVTVWFVLVAALLATAAIGLSLAWNRH